MSRWYRAYEGTVNDPKLAEVALVVGCSRSVVIGAWHAILESCASTNEGGRFDITARRIAVILQEPIATIEGIMQEMQELGLLTEGAVAAWRESQQLFRPPAHEWRVIRSAVFERDDFTCAYCGERGGKLECDHVSPVARGGGHDLDNLKTACFACNRAKSDKKVEDWMRRNG